MRKQLLLAGLLSLSFSWLPWTFAAQSSSQQSPVQTAQHKQTKSNTTHSPTPAQSNGERIFAQNCSRCHAAPDSFPSSISGTVVRHMRVRASLSAEDERALLRFLNP